MSTPVTTALPARDPLWSRLRAQLRNLAPFATLIVLVALFSGLSPSFATWGNLANILQQVSITAIIAVGLTFVILCAEIDLSVASVANATDILLAFLTVQDASVNIANLPLPGGLAIPLALAGCLALGAVTAFGVTRIGIPSFIMTLAMLQIGNGIGALLVRGQIYFGSAQQNQFDNYLLDAISAVVVGGTSLFGGQGGIGNTIIGLLVLGVLNNGLDHVRMDSFLKILIRGLVLLLALVINVYAQRLRSQARAAG